MKHIANFSREDAEDILDGEKLIDIRFSKGKIPPFGVVSTGDLVYIKSLKEDVIGQFRVKKVIFFDGITSDDLKDIKTSFGEKILLDEKGWKKAEGLKFCTLIFIGSLNRFLTSPIKLPKKGLKNWLVLP